QRRNQSDAAGLQSQTSAETTGGRQIDRGFGKTKREKCFGSDVLCNVSLPTKTMAALERSKSRANSFPRCLTPHAESPFCISLAVPIYANSVLTQSLPWAGLKTRWVQGLIERT